MLQIQVAYFQYLANRALLDAQRTTLAEAQANLEAAEERRRVGLATIADVLQARTAASQAQLDLQTTEGNLQTARGALALALGLPANLPYDVDSTAAAVPVAALADSVDALIASALRGPARPRRRALGGGGGARRHRRGARQPAAVAQPDGHGRADLRHHHPQRRQQLQPVARARPSRSSTASPGSTTSGPPQYQAEAARGPERDASGSRWSSRCSARTTPCRPPTRRVRHGRGSVASAQQSSEVALARYKAGVGSVLDLLAAQSALAERAGAAGGRPARMERLAGAAGARRRRARPARAGTSLHLIHRHHDVPSR